VNNFRGVDSANNGRPSSIPSRLIEPPVTLSPIDLTEAYFSPLISASLHGCHHWRLAINGIRSPGKTLTFSSRWLCSGDYQFSLRHTVVGLNFPNARNASKADVSGALFNSFPATAFINTAALLSKYKYGVLAIKAKDGAINRKRHWYRFR
jgi:hypothetical protein